MRISKRKSKAWAFFPSSDAEKLMEDIPNKIVNYLGIVEDVILLFGKHVGQFFPSAIFKIGRFHTDESDLIVQDVIEGNIIQMASRVVDTLRTKYLLSPIHYEGLQRVEQLEVPENLFHVFRQITLHLVLYLLRNAEAGLGNGTYYCPDGVAVATMRNGKANGILEG